MTIAILIVGLTITACWVGSVSCEMAARPFMVCRYMVGASIMITCSCMAVTVWLAMLTSGAIAWQV
jgi:hypothetical protein